MSFSLLGSCLKYTAPLSADIATARWQYLMYWLLCHCRVAIMHRLLCYYQVAIIYWSLCRVHSTRDVDVGLSVDGVGWAGYWLL